MLKQRILTAVALLLVLLPAMFYPDPRWLCGIALVMLTAGAWEWARMNGYGQMGSVLAGGTCLLLCTVSWLQGWLTQPMPFIWLVGGALWVALTIWLLYAGVENWSNLPRLPRMLVGIAALWLAWLALAQGRYLGVNFLLSALALVWVADIGAYFAGRRWGTRWVRRKLAPAISPGKSWEGVAGGAAAVLLLACLWVLADAKIGPATKSLYSELAERGLVLALAGLLLMVGMSVAGDLVESLVKRAAGVKDSSQLLPGHGGVLDRVDALLPTLPLAMALHSWLGMP